MGVSPISGGAPQTPCETRAAAGGAADAIAGGIAGGGCLGGGCLGGVFLGGGAGGLTVLARE